MKYFDKISVGIAKIFPKYQSVVDNLEEQNISLSTDFLIKNYIEIFQHSYCQIDVYDSEGDILLSNTKHFEPEDNYNIINDPRLEYVDIEESFHRSLEGEVVYLPAVEYYINATEAIWLEMKLIPAKRNGKTHIICLSYNISRFKKKEFEYLRNMANFSAAKPRQKVDLLSDHVTFLKYFIKMLPIELAVYDKNKTMLCSNYTLTAGYEEYTFRSSLVPQNTKMLQFDYLGNKLYVKLNTPITDSLPLHNDILCVTDLDGTILDISDSVEAHLGQSRDKLIGNNIISYYQYPQERDSIIRKVMENKSISNYNLSLRSRDGIVKKHKTNIKLIESSEKPVLVSSLREEDIAVKDLEKTYRNEELLQETQRFSKTGSWSYDLVENEFIFSSEIERIFEIQNTCRGIKCLTRSISVKDKIKTLRFFSLLQRSDEVQQLECKIITPGCVTKILYSEGKLERDYYGNPKRIVGFTQDISKLRQSEEEKEHAKSEIETLYNSIPTMLLNTDSQYRITAASKYLLDKLGYCKSNLLEKKLNDIILDDGVPFTPQESNETITKDAEIINSDGNLLHVRMTIAPKLKSHRNNGYTIVLMDISDKERTNRALKSKTTVLAYSVESKDMTLNRTIEELQAENERNKKLQSQLVKAQLELSKALETEQESGELKSRFIDMISHEYRTPLTVIMSSAYIIERLAEMADDKKIAKHIDKVIKASNAMTGLLDSTLDMVFHNKGDYSFVPALFNIEHCIEKVVREIEIIDGQNHKIKYQNYISEPTLYTDLRLCRLSIYNVVMNAVKYSSKETEVLIKSEEIDGIIIVSVKDFGCGIPQCDRPMIYTPFYRGSQTGGLVPGTGLGLTVTKQCLAKINGNVTYVTQENAGTTFYLKFPRRFIMKS